MRLRILHAATAGPISGVELSNNLTAVGHKISPGTLYPTLHQMERQRYLRSHTEVVGGRRRRYYRATPAGRKVLREARKKLLELVAEVVEGHDQPFRTLQEKRRRQGRPS